MVGERVGQYLVTEALGSGRTGILYLAVHVETGHRAVVQRVSKLDLGEAFVADATLALALKRTPTVEERKTREGQLVLFAALDEGAPGSGHTEHTNTERLSPPRERARPTRVRSLAIGLAVLFFTSASFGAWLASRATPTPPHVAEPEVLGDAPMVSADAGVDLVLVPVTATPVEERLTTDAGNVVQDVSTKAVTRTASCVVNASWKQQRRLDLQELANAPKVVRDATLNARVEVEGARLARLVESATASADCRRVEADLGALARLVRDAARQPDCTFDDGFRRWVRQSRDELAGMGGRDAGARWAQLDDALADALVGKQCRQSLAVLNQMRALVGLEPE